MKIERAIFIIPVPKLKNNSVIRKNATITTIFGVKDWWLTVKDTLPPIGHVVGKTRLSRDRTTGCYCSVLNKNWINNWNKYGERNNGKQSHLLKVRVSTSPRVINKSRILSTKYSEKKYKS